MPVCSEREDVIVITDEAHRSQYSTLALNMRRALPERRLPRLHGHAADRGRGERTREVFGDYVSTYNFRDSIEDGATVPLFYENRIPELQIINERFDEELTGILEQAELDDSAGAGARRGASRPSTSSSPARSACERIAADLVRHFVGRGFLGKAMFVAIDKATAVRMYDLVARGVADPPRRAARSAPGGCPPLERAGRRRADRVHARRPTWRSSSPSRRTRSPTCARLGLDIAPHRKRMLDEDLDERFKDPDDPFRLVFVCAMWMTGFDVPSCSTIYLDRPMRNHTLMQTIARANRVFPEKENGLIVDYVGVFRHLEAALAIYAAARDGEDGDGDHPRQVGARRRARGGDRRAASSSPSAGTSTSTRSPAPRASSSSPCATRRSRRCSSTT